MYSLFFEVGGWAIPSIMPAVDRPVEMGAVLGSVCSRMYAAVATGVFSGFLANTVPLPTFAQVVTKMVSAL